MAGPCEYVIMFKPLWSILTLYAAWPMKVTKGGRVVRSPLLMLGTGLLFCVSCWREWITCLYHINFDAKGNVPLILLNTQFLVYVLSILILASFIFETGRNARYAARWHEFQPQFERVCGRAMRNPSLRRRFKVTAVALAVGWPLGVIVLVSYAGEDSHVTLPEILYRSYCTTVLCLASTNWRMHCAFLRNASAMLVDALKEALEGDTLPRKTVVRFIRTWLELRDLTCDGLESICLTSFFVFAVMALTLVLSTFNNMYIVFNGFSKLGIFMAGLGFLKGLTLVRLFNEAHCVNEELGENAMLALARAKISRFPKDTLQEVE